MADLKAMELAETLALNMLRGMEAPTSQDIRSRAELVVSMLRSQDASAELDLEALVRELEARCSIWVPASIGLADDRDHVEWLSDRRGDIDWRFWLRYETYLRDELRWAPATIARMDESTDDILHRLEDPRRSGSWDRRGMVAGQVQSGKTSNYIGLICKAADAGYGLIVILAGQHNSLRAQTQLRVDAGFLGFDTQKRMKFDQSNVRMGVGQLPGAKLYHASSLTSSAELGDFNLSVARQVGLAPGGADPVVLVVKKNKSILENLIRWSTLILQQRDPDSGRNVVRDVPLLVIDDEADNASVNTKAVPIDETGKRIDEHDLTAINGLIRDLLQRFDKSAYVGYTATPFANIFIPSDSQSTKFGEDLFPRSFIINLPAPSDYVGPAEVFGLREDATAGIEARVGLPVIRLVTDHEPWIPDGHKKETVPGPLPASLRNAIRTFLLAGAIRAVRGQDNVHNSMLVHVTRFIAVQRLVADQISDEVSFLVKRLRYGDGASNERLVEELRSLYASDFVPTSQQFPPDRRGPIPSWAEILAVLSRVASRVETVVINGTAKDVLQYFDRPNGLTAIVVGGDKLSRGLTLEGLTVSYYLRASKMYDTLMQMGRWFGYRPKYSDVCRLFTTEELVRSYREITVANEELRQRFDYMSLAGATPQDFWLGVRNSPDMMVTAHAKMRHGQTVMLSYSDDVSETLAFDVGEQPRHHNLELTNRLVDLLDREAQRREAEHRVVWSGVSGQHVLAYVESFITHVDARRAQSAILAKYIRNRIADGELGAWTVALMEGEAGSFVRLAGRDRELVLRDAAPERGGAVRIDRLVSPRDEMIDLSPAQIEAALEATIAAWRINPGKFKTQPQVPRGLLLRRQRSEKNGLLLLYPFDSKQPLQPPDLPLIGLAISFPHSDRAQPVEYTVNNIYWQQEFAL